VGQSNGHLHKVDETSTRYARHIAFHSDTNTHQPRNNQVPGAADDDTREAGEAGYQIVSRPRPVHRIRARRLIAEQQEVFSFFNSFRAQRVLARE
jgi:hypothetical protein